jgi:2-polyprenyl-3-methyl-5-hydroxy-6-metoxy-1,4-benzoquinol methylase
MKDNHYEFGNNWRGFISSVDCKQIDAAAENLAWLVGDLRGKTFLDIGSGSGLHSLAALNLGAASVTAIDYDPMSVHASTQLLTTFAKDKDWNVSVGDILAADLPDKIFEVVYSWGVLHHTGKIWQAIDNAQMFCQPGGLFALALYVKTPFCKFWKQEKQFYTRHKMCRAVMDAIFICLLLLRTVLSGTNPFRYIREYNLRRGMNFFTDVRDWLGGYPYESVSAEDLEGFLRERGFFLVRKRNTEPGIGVFGTACGEWVFRKD